MSTTCMYNIVWHHIPPIPYNQEFFVLPVGCLPHHTPHRSHITHASLHVSCLGLFGICFCLCSFVRDFCFSDFLFLWWDLWGHVSAFSYMEGQTNNSGLMAKLYMERQAKSRESWNQRQGNQNAYYTKTPSWISSKLTPADASRTCASFCIWSHYCADAKLCARAVSLPSTANLFLITKQPRDKNSEPCQQILRGFRNERCQHNNWWTRTTLTGVSIKNSLCTNSKGYFHKILYYICESWYEPFEKYASRSPGWFKNLWTITTL